MITISSCPNNRLITNCNLAKGAYNHLNRNISHCKELAAIPNLGGRMCSVRIRLGNVITWRICVVIAFTGSFWYALFICLLIIWVETRLSKFSLTLKILLSNRFGKIKDIGVINFLEKTILMENAGFKSQTYYVWNRFEEEFCPSVIELWYDENHYILAINTYLIELPW